MGFLGRLDGHHFYNEGTQCFFGAALLDSYEAERRPVHNFVMDEAVANHAHLGNDLWCPGLEDDGMVGESLRREVGARVQAAKMCEFYTLGVTLGYRYEGSSVIVDDGSRAPARDFINYRPSAYPGCLAPHAWLHDGSSLYDHFGSGFTLLATAGADAAGLAAADAAARAAGVPMTIIQPQEAALADLYQAPYTLIRPDQHVAWRGTAVPGDAAALFACVTGRAQAKAGEPALAQ